VRGMIADYLLRATINKTAAATAAQGPDNGPGYNRLSHLLDSPKIHVLLIGTGTPIVVEGRAGSCVAIVGCGVFFLIDAGPGSVRNCMLLGLPLKRLTAIFITHYHSDHIGDLGEVSSRQTVFVTKLYF
jgi:glyoxylase-like metal-dependent hydrolase (beta-lactamase superfamily II)